MSSNSKKFALIFILSLISGIYALNEESPEVVELSLIGEKNMIYEIEPNYIYKFVIEDQNYLYHFQEDIKDILQIYSKDNSLETSRKNLYFEKGEIIYANHLLNLKETIKIKINSIPVYDKLNSFETINEGQYFSIKSEEDSIAYFDSIDKNSKIFISETEESSKFESIIGDFFTCPKNQIYFIKVELFDTSVLKKYFLPININGEINKKMMSQIFYIYNNLSHIFLTLKETQ